MGKMPSPSVSLDVRRARINPSLLLNTDKRGNFIHKVLVLEIGNTRTKVEAAVSSFGYHRNMLARFPSYHDATTEQMKRDDIHAYGGTMGLLSHEGGYALVINGYSVEFDSIPPAIGMAVARKISTLLEQMKRIDGHKHKKNRQMSGIDWRWVGTAPDVSTELILGER